MFCKLNKLVLRKMILLLRSAWNSFISAVRTKFTSFDYFCVEIQHAKCAENLSLVSELKYTDGRTDKYAVIMRSFYPIYFYASNSFRLIFNGVVVVFSCQDNTVIEHTVGDNGNTGFHGQRWKLVACKGLNPFLEGERLTAMLGGSLVTTAWRVLRLRMEGTPSRYGG
jgi:hypothetical protein